jgi:iron complex outermembrane receptor protein
MSMRMQVRGGLLLVTASSAALLAGTAFAQQAADAAGVEQIVVTGTRLATGFTAPTPVAVMSDQQLQARGAVALADAVQDIPAFRPVGPTQGVSGTLAPGQSLFDLRALGRTRTLVLINGQRPVPTNTDGSFDANTIPTSLVARTEVVTGGASAAYGSDAIAGVVNFVLKDRIDGFVGNAMYGLSDEGDTKQFALNLGFGTEFAGGKGRLIMGGEYSERDPSPTMYGREWGARQPGLVQLTAARPAGTPGNVMSENVEYVLPAGGLINGCVIGGAVLNGAACPVGNLTFNASGQPIPFQFGTLVGTTQQVAPATGSSSYGYSTAGGLIMQQGGDRRNFLANVAYDVTPDTTIWAQFHYGRFQVSGAGSYFTRPANTILINADNPYIPAAIATQMAARGITQLRMSGLTPPPFNAHNRNWMYQTQVGARGKIFSDWQWDLTFADGESELLYDTHNMTVVPNYYASIYAVRDAQGNTVCGPMATNPNRSTLTALQLAVVGSGCVPTNVFGIGAQSAAANAYTSPPENTITSYKRRSAEFNIAGSPFSNWAGPVSVAAGASWRRDKMSFTVPPAQEVLTRALAYFAYNPISGGGQTSAKELYGEMGFPLLRDLPLAQALDLNGAVRWTDYDPSGTVATWKVGATWDVNSSIRLRGTRSRDIRAPNIPELYLPSFSYGLVTNPRTGVSALQANQNRPNPNLKPEVAQTWTGGVVLQPGGFLSGFRASVDYYKIRTDSIIATVPAAQVLARYYLQGDQNYAQFITFDSSPLGFSAVTSALLNQNTQQTRGVDIEVEYRLPADLFVPGRFTLTAAGNHLTQLETFDSTGVSLGNLAGYLPKDRWTFNVMYNLNRFSGYVQVKTNSQMKYAITLIGPDDSRYNPALPNSINKNTFPSMAYWNIGANYRLLESEGRRLEVYGVVDNVLDKDPPYAAYGVMQSMGTGPSGGYVPYDPIGRYFKLGFRFQY